jgi:SNF2 family DNA or RNA helicase
MSAAALWTSRTALLHHQGEATAKLLPARVGALFMEMGTGKSRTAIELARLRQGKIDSVVWFCPVSLKETIRREILKHTDCPATDIHVFDDHTSETTVLAVRWYIVGIESMSSSARVIFTVRKLITARTLVVVDESGYIKGARSRRTERITLLARDARYRLILTGTPLSQGIVDLFAQMRFLSPKILGYRSFHQFCANHIVWSERFPGLIEGEKNRAYLAQRIKPYVYQVTKDECLTLPDKLFSARYCRLTQQQAEAYAAAKERFLLDELPDDDAWGRSLAIFRLFTALQRIVCGHQRAADGTLTSYPSRRIETLLHVLGELPNAEPVVIWAKYRQSVTDIGAALVDLRSADQIHEYHGGLSDRARQINLDAWRDRGGALVATQAAGGHGHDMTAARYAIYYANGFKYSERQQTEDRLHRIGQTRAPTYIDLWCDAGIDTRIDQALARKANAVAAFRDEVEKVRRSNKDRVRRLIADL